MNADFSEFRYEFDTRKVSAESILGAFSMMPRIQDSYSWSCAAPAQQARLWHCLKELPMIATQDHEMHQE